MDTLNLKAMYSVATKSKRASALFLLLQFLKHYRVLQLPDLNETMRQKVTFDLSLDNYKLKYERLH
jgi:hypothetical protein